MLLNSQTYHYLLEHTKEAEVSDTERNISLQNLTDQAASSYTFHERKSSSAVEADSGMAGSTRTEADDSSAVAQCQADAGERCSTTSLSDMQITVGLQDEGASAKCLREGASQKSVTRKALLHELPPKRLPYQKMLLPRHTT